MYYIFLSKHISTVILCTKISYDIFFESKHFYKKQNNAHNMILLKLQSNKIKRLSARSDLGFFMVAAMLLIKLFRYLA